MTRSVTLARYCLRTGFSSRNSGHRTSSTNRFGTRACLTPGIDAARLSGSFA